MKKNFEEKLEIERLQNIIKGTNLGTWEWEIQTGKVTFNEQWANMIGYTMKELEPSDIKTWEKLTHPDDLEKSHDDLNRVFKKELPYYEAELRMKHKDGHWVWILDKGKVVEWDKDGTPLLMMGSHIDISLVKNLTQLLEKEKDLFELILNSTLEAIYGTDIDGMCTFVNQSFLDYFGYTDSDEIIGKNMHDLIHHKNENGTKILDTDCEFTKALHEEKFLRKKDTVWHKDGSPLIVEHIMNPQMENNKIVGAVYTVKDLTIYEQYEKEIKFEQQLSQTYLNLLNVMVLALDSDGNITLINNKGCEVLGLSKFDIIGKNWFDQFIPNTIFKEVKHIFKAVFDGSSEFALHYENEIITASGEIRYISWNNTIIHDINGNVKSVLCAGEDITESKRVRDELIHSQANLNLAQSVANVGSWDLDLSNRKLWISKQTSEILEVEAQEGFIDHQQILDILDTNSANLLTQAIDNLVRDLKPFDIIQSFTTKNGNMKYINARAIIFTNQNEVPTKVIGVILDITDSKIAEEKLIRAANFDFLTGLHNRRYYESHLPKLDIEENYPITLIMADINGLKLINDAFGHVAGDDLLISAAKIIYNECLPHYLVARIGGDEFVIVATNTGQEEADDLINRINILASKVVINSIPLSISFGYMTKTKQYEDINNVFQGAEDMMYREKLLQIPSTRSSAIEAILNTLYEKDVTSEEHSRRVSQLSEKLAIAAKLSRQDVAEVKTAGLLHDIGKIIIPSAVLNKIGVLNSQEYDVIKTHCEIGYRILHSSQHMRDVSKIVLAHHEHYDGSGYPLGIKGEEIPLKARIISIADSFDAMTSPRTYRKLFSDKEALQEIIDCSGKDFDPELVVIFKKHFTKITKK
jgi:diguanylate cyclase (GGDEF)-like protein/PAS domain S-box-containing protein/putative nucleotidyltransferase with HDIG domain